MNSRQIVATALALIGTTWTLALAETREGQLSELSVHTYNYSGVSADDLAAARRHVEAIFERATITISWRDCRTSGRDAADVLPNCPTDRRPNEVMLRIMTSSTPGLDRATSLGFSLVNRENAHSAWLSSVFTNRVAVLASQTGIDPTLLLGRAIAHEIGHLLIGSTDHARAGLMRAFWSHAELTHGGGSEWVFLEKEARAMRSSLSTRVTRNTLARR
ncbi:MAG TPA: hypothetical protein VGC23_03100 [Vicinamibacterales bacterium]